jgi:hypothetical protein
LDGRVGSRELPHYNPAFMDVLLVVEFHGGFQAITHGILGISYAMSVTGENTIWVRMVWR